MLDKANDAARIEAISATIAMECASVGIPKLIAEIDNSLAAHQLSCAHPGQLDAEWALSELHRTFKEAETET